MADGHGGLVYRRWGGDKATSQHLQPDGCGIPAPAEGRTLQPDELACLLVPALAIDRRGVRLGYGGGYYDRLRRQTPWKAVRALVVFHRRPASQTRHCRRTLGISLSMAGSASWDLVVPRDRRIMSVT